MTFLLYVPIVWLDKHVNKNLCKTYEKLSRERNEFVRNHRAELFLMNL